MKSTLTFLVALLLTINSFGQDCGDFYFFNFKDTIVNDWAPFNQPKPGFYFESTYDTLRTVNTGYTSFFLEDENGDTITHPNYYIDSRFFPWNEGDTLGYSMVLDSGLTSLPANFNGFLVTANPKCKIAFSNVGVSVPQIENDKTISIYPNPNAGTFWISNPILSAEQHFEIKLFSLEGKLVYSEIVLEKTFIDISGIKKGVYFLQTPFQNKMERIIISN